jgi:transketolase
MYNTQYLKPDWRTADKRAIRDGIGEGLLRIGRDERVVVLTANLEKSTRVEQFAYKYTDRFYDVGVAEQNMAGVAAGLALEGKVPFMTSFATFSPGRNLEQIRVSIALTNANVKIVSTHAGLSVGLNGPSHQALEDIALMRTLPNMTVLVPADARECAAAIEAAYKLEGPVYIRATRPETPDFTKDIPFEIGKAYVYREGKDVSIFACGIQVWDALMVAESLEQEGISCEVINISTIKPLDRLTIAKSAKKTRIVVTIEDHNVMGGMGSAIAEFLSEFSPVHILRLGVNDKFGRSGEWGEVYQQFGLDRVSLAEKIRRFVLD